MNRRHYQPQPATSAAALESLLERSIVDAGGELPFGSTNGVTAAPAPPPDGPRVALVEFSDGPLGELFTAMSNAQGEMGHAAKNADNPFFDSKYADLSAVLDVGRPLLAKHGLSIIQFPGTTRGGRAVIVSVLGHTSGQWMRSHLELPVKNPKPKTNGRGESFDATPTPQAFGSSFSHGRRYAYAAITGIAQIDDDGNLASGHDDMDQRQYEQPPRTAYRENARQFDRRMATGTAAAQGIDTGPFEPGTREAAAFVGDQKVAALRQRRATRAAAPAEPPPAPKPSLPELGTKSGEVRRAFQAVRDVLGERRYNAELNASGIADPMNLRSLSDAKVLYARFLSLIKQEGAA